MQEFNNSNNPTCDSPLPYGSQISFSHEEVSSCKDVASLQPTPAQQEKQPKEKSMNQSMNQPNHQSIHNSFSQADSEFTDFEPNDCSLNNFSSNECFYDSSSDGDDTSVVDPQSSSETADYQYLPVEDQLDSDTNVPGLFADLVRQGHVEDVKVLLLIWPQLVHNRDERNWSALHLAAFHGQAGMVELLLSQGADILEADVNGRLPLFYAAYPGQSDTINCLFQAMLAREGMAPTSGIARTFAQLVEVGPVSIADEMVIAGYEVDTQDDHGATALHYAARNSRAQVVQQLLEWGADPNIQDSEGNTPLHWAVLGQCQQHGLSHPWWTGDSKLSKHWPRQRSPYQPMSWRQPQEKAISQGEAWRYSIRVLIEENTDTQLRNHRGHTARDLAELTCQFEVMDWISFW